MKAPDKIYVEICEDGIFAFEQPPFEESIEYVRKDALIEMLKGYNHPLTRVVVQELIDKINEL